ncbi:MAG: hypothetical protein ACLQJ0_24605 [Steroidobacteraceae bacterium]|jgi:hypothetical protein
MRAVNCRFLSLGLNLCLLAALGASTAITLPEQSSASGADSNPSQYVLTTTGDLDLTNSIVGAPVQVTGLIVPFGSTPPDFTASPLATGMTVESIYTSTSDTLTAASLTVYLNI